MLQVDLIANKKLKDEERNFDDIFSRFGDKLVNDGRTDGHTDRICCKNIALCVASLCDVCDKTGNI